MDHVDLDDARKFYAKELARLSASPDPRLEEVFYRVHREDFLPPGPWKLLVEGQYVETPNSDPVHLYRNVLVALDHKKRINNGQPSLHATWIGAVTPQPGETISQIGLGMGYYTAILALLVEPGGRLIGYEIESNLAEAARRNLAGFGNVSVKTGDAVSLELSPSDLIYVSAAVAAPPESWLAALRPGGRLIFPWRPTAEVSLAMLVTRTPQGFKARPLMPSRFISCVGAASPKGTALAPTPSTAQRIRSLYLNRERVPDGSAVAIYENVWFSSARVRG